MLQKLQDELAELENDEQAQKEKDFFEKLQALLKDHGYSLHELHSMLSSALETQQSTGTQRRKSSGRGQGQEVEYNGHTYKVNAIGRQPRDTKELLDELGMTPTEFLNSYKK